MEFCVIPDPYNPNSNKKLLFISYAGYNKVSEKLCNEEDYQLVMQIFNQFGYDEIDFCVFESETNLNLQLERLKESLIEAGMKYSKPFEFSVIGEFHSFHRELMEKQQEDYMVNTGVITDGGFSFYASHEPISTKYKVIEVGEKISLHFFGFLQCHFSQEFILELIGDMYSKENSNTRNFLKIMKSDFVRLESKNPNPNVILLQSTKTFADFINELDFLHKGAFKFTSHVMSQDGDMVVKTKEYIYDLIEVKKNLWHKRSIVFEVNIKKYYDDIIEASKKIKKELSIEQKRIISLENIRPEALILKQKLKDKMLNLAEADEFEKANLIKRDIEFVEHKIQTIDTLEEKNISRQEYYKTFCLNA